MIVNFGTILQYSLCESKFRNCHKTMKIVGLHDFLAG